MSARRKALPPPESPPDIDEERLSSPALRTFFAIASAWGLSNEEARRILGDPPRSTYYEWKRAGGRLTRDTLERISYVLGIYKALQILLPDPAAADAWPRKPNTAPLFGGEPALSRMTSGNVADLYVVRQYLDAQRGGE
ncbi:MAG TPA: MbcA/ParS/Xre antitoxin family protein [Casimicrobiaceae bacterium]|nr:MbcA/ParS/Xre antitoxin family protein [Casimicrobiaceae bacterium]